MSKFRRPNMKIAVEGCGHGTLDAIYASVEKACNVKRWIGVDLVIIGGDFQAMRNERDLLTLSAPRKYWQMGDFHRYYSGARRAPYLTVFVGGNHEASSHMVELPYGGWVAPNIYYMGPANVIRVGGLRLAGLSGIWKGYDYRKPHFERLPFSADDVKSVYHVRELDVRRLLQLRSQVDVCLSHDWPRAVEASGDSRRLFRQKSDFEQESRAGTLGSPAARYVLDRLRPKYWFSAHMHVKFAALVKHSRGDTGAGAGAGAGAGTISSSSSGGQPAAPAAQPVKNEEEIDLEISDAEEEPVQKTGPVEAKTAQIDKTNDVPEELKAQLPPSFTTDRKNGPHSTPTDSAKRADKPSLPFPADITNMQTRFLALDKCLPKRDFLQLLAIRPSGMWTRPNTESDSAATIRIEYDPEWLAITRVFGADFVVTGDPASTAAEDLGEAHYRPLIDAERHWVDEHIVQTDKLTIPRNFALTAPIYDGQSQPKTSEPPQEYANPQTKAFCDLLQIPDPLHLSDEEAERRRNMIAAAPLFSPSGRGGRGGAGSGGHAGFGQGGGRGSGRGRGRRNHGRGRGRGRGQGRG